jgi:hypothetical protein
MRNVQCELSGYIHFVTIWFRRGCPVALFTQRPLAGMGSLVKPFPAKAGTLNAVA